MADFRNELTDTKHYLCVPAPLLAYLCTLDLTSKQLAIFLLHWGAGQINGNWTSKLAVTLVAELASCSEATVKRAYSKLIKFKLIRRTPAPKSHSGNRDITLTEVLIPDHTHENMRSAPNRTCVAKGHSLDTDKIGATPTAHGKEAYPNSSENSKHGTNAVATLKKQGSGIRRLNELNRYVPLLNQKITEIPGISEPPRIMQEVIWSIAYGQFSKENIKKSINIALKLLRNKRWKTPHHMPVNWILGQS